MYVCGYVRVSVLFSSTVPIHKRSQKVCLLIGAGGTGKTTIILRLILKVFVLYFPCSDEEDRYCILTFSHAQGAAISDDNFRAQTAHTSVEYRVASLRNIHMGLNKKAESCKKKWVPKVLVIEDEVSLFPAMVQNMVLYRVTKSREEAHHLSIEDYNRQGHLFGHMPIVIIAGDFLQIKPPKEISVADDLDALRRGSRPIHPEHTAAQQAILDIQDVIEFTKSKRFKDDKMPGLMSALRSAGTDKPLPESELEKLRKRTIDRCGNELCSERFEDGYLVAMYWDNVARSIHERCHRDARKLKVPLFCLQAADQRTSYQSVTQNLQVLHSLLSIQNIHKTGKLAGMLLIHEGMKVRLSDVLDNTSGLVKDLVGTVVSIKLHSDDARRLHNLPSGYQFFVPEFIPEGIWVEFPNYKKSPLLPYIEEDIRRKSHGDDDQEKDLLKKAKSMVFVEIANSTFNIDIRIGQQELNLRVIRWQFPLTHAMVRTAYSCQGMTLEGGVVMDLRRAGGGMSDEDWWLHIYVMLSRPRKLENIILLGFTKQVEELLRKGPPPRLVEIMGFLRKRAAKTMAALQK